MTFYHAAQLLLAVIAAGLIVQRIRTLMYRAPLPARPFRRVLEPPIRDGDIAEALRRARQGEPAWIAEVAGAALEAHQEGHDPWMVVDPWLLELRYQAERGLWTLRAMASLGSAGGLLGAVYAILVLLMGDHGVQGLMAGLPERLAFQRALLSLLLGAVTAGVCLYARSVLVRQAARLLRDVREVRAAVMEALGVKDPTEAPL